MKTGQAGGLEARLWGEQRRRGVEALSAWRGALLDGERSGWWRDLPLWTAEVRREYWHGGRCVGCVAPDGVGGNVTDARLSGFVGRPVSGRLARQVRARVEALLKERGVVTADPERLLLR